MSLRPPILFLDANVLYSACCRDLLIEASLAGQCHCRWTAEILAEVRGALMRARSDLRPNQVRRLFDLLASACPEAQVRCRPAGDDHLPTMRDPADAHVVRGAWEAQADIILTFNLRHFPCRVLGPFGLVAMTPDAWLCAQAVIDSATLTEVAERCRRRLTRPHLSRTDHLEALRRSGLRRFAAFLASR
jgi:predicted nucleic acid-binding protein